MKWEICLSFFLESATDKGCREGGRHAPGASGQLIQVSKIVLFTVHYSRHLMV